MNKQELFDRVDAFISTHGYVPVNVRVHFDNNYGLDRQTVSLWLVGKYSADETLCMGIDTLFLKRYHSAERAEKDASRFRAQIKKEYQQ